MSDDVNPYNAGPVAAPGAPQAVGSATVVVFELDVDDLIAFSLYHYDKSPALRRQRRVIRLWLPAVLIAMGAVVAATKFDEVPGIMLASICFATGAILFLLHPLLVRRGTARILAKMYAEGSNRAVLGWRRLSIGRDGVAMVSELIESRMKWEAIEKIEASDEYVFIYMGSANAHVVPMRAFGSPAHFNVFVETARSYWQRAREVIGPTA